MYLLMAIKLIPSPTRNFTFYGNPFLCSSLSPSLSLPVLSLSLLFLSVSRSASRHRLSPPPPFSLFLSLAFLSLRQGDLFLRYWRKANSSCREIIFPFPGVLPLSGLDFRVLELFDCSRFYRPAEMDDEYAKLIRRMNPPRYPELSSSPSC